MRLLKKYLAAIVCTVFIISSAHGVFAAEPTQSKEDITKNVRTMLSELNAKAVKESASTLNSTNNKIEKKKAFKSGTVNLSAFTSKAQKGQEKSTAKFDQNLQAAAIASASNSDPSSAIYVDLNSLYENYITSEGEQNWYYTYVSSPTKLTAFMLPPFNVDYDLYLFKLNLSTGELENQLSSEYSPSAGLDEQVSTIVEPGYYFLCTSSYQGFDLENPYYFALITSDTYDSAEPDDNALQAPQKPQTFTVNQSIDNAFDCDWIQYPVQKDSYVSFNLSNIPQNCVYKVELRNSSLQSLVTMDANQIYKYALGQGTYFIRIYSEQGSELNSNYAFSANKIASALPVSSIVVSNISTNGGNGGYINYGYGDKWRVYTSINISGNVKDAYGEPVANAGISVGFYNPYTYQLEGSNPKYFSGYSDESGNFYISSSLPHAAGEFMYATYVSYHYYDIANLVIASGNAQNNMELYHFAYSMYRPH